ncbi:Hsp20/alpha crystallin family protein [Candidatus Woesearchaeota archaeon]|nr:Hsp20/alpha crystallin family protein [Candidatus Woesearchaeota archaeon]
MNIWDPFEEMRRIHEDIERVFSEFSGQKMLPGKKEGRELARIPVTEIREAGSDVVATFEIPGTSKENIELNVTDNSIEVKTEQKHEKEEKGKDFYGYRSVSRSFYRKLPLPADVRAEEAKAEYAEGVLKVVMPKKQAITEKRKIDIR